MKKLIKKILGSEIFIEKPPVLIDIGASGKLKKEWKELSEYSIGIAFDADERDFQYIDKEQQRWKKLVAFNCLVTDDHPGEKDFYLTAFPYCSSLLPPLEESLQQYAFSPLFKVVETRKVTTITLTEALNKEGINYVDWFKTDSQGIDLRLFKSLGEISEKVLIAEFEPGLIDAYQGEDKLSDLLLFMENKHFWIGEMDVRGSQRISLQTLKDKLKPFQQKQVRYFIKSSPGWVSVSFYNNLPDRLHFGQRDILLLCVFSLIRKQYGFVLDLLERYRDMIDPGISQDIENYLRNRFRKSYFDFILDIPSKIIKRIF